MHPFLSVIMAERTALHVPEAPSGLASAKPKDKIGLCISLLFGYHNLGNLGGYHNLGNVRKVPLI